MARILRRLKIRSVDLCKEGANQEAHIRMKKEAEAPVLVTKEVRALKTVMDNIDAVATSDEERAQMRMHAFMTFEKHITEEAAPESAEAPADTAETDAGQDLATEDPQTGVEPETKSEDAKGSEADTGPDQEDEAEEDEEEEQRVKKGFVLADMTPEDRKALQDLMAKYGIKFEDDEDKEDVEVEAEATEEEVAAQASKESDDPVKKSMEAITEQMREMKKAMDTRKMAEELEKYKQIGKDPEEMAKMLIEVEEPVRKEFLAVMDAAMEMQDSVGLFKEYGSTGRGAGTITDHAAAEETARRVAKELMEKDPNLTQADAIVKAYETTPELADFR